MLEPPPASEDDDETHVSAVSITEGTYIIGRSRSADLFIDDPSASRRHARIIVSLGETYLEDLGSKNGTLLNGARLAGTRKLGVGDRITIGSHHFSMSPESVLQEVGPSATPVEEPDWAHTADQTERTLDLLDVLLNERYRGSEHARSLVHLVVTSVDEVLDTVGATRPALTRHQAYRINCLIGAIGVQALSPSVLAWQANARRRLDSLVQQGSYSAA
jgi:hypothetical protein